MSDSNRRREKPGEYGTQLIAVTVPGGSYTASATTRFLVPALGRTVKFSRLVGTHTVAPVSATGTILAHATKITGTNTRTVLSNPLDLEAIANLKSGSAKNLSGLAAGTLVVKPGDGLEIEVVSTAAIGTQATAPLFTLEFFVLD